MIKPTVLPVLIGLFLIISGCGQDPASGRGFRLPDGDAEEGRQVFLYMQCNQCHTVAGMALPAVAGADPPYVELGGNITRVKNYGELVTSIINPSHKLANGYAKERVSENGESNMYVYNRHMTVQELIDLVAFLQSRYRIVPPPFDYRVYPR